MGELFRREAAADPLLFSGERLTSSISGQVEIEHYHRYFLAREFCRGKDVLDVAAGEGYGTALLAQVANSAIGIEINPNAVTVARREFARSNLRYEEGDARSLNIPDSSIDVVVSFETLEHLAEQDQFLGEIRRVLRPEGMLIISTPDSEVYSAPGIPANPYHVKELNSSEFSELLQRYFHNFTFAAQRAIIGSIISGSDQNDLPFIYERRGNDTIDGSRKLLRAPYIVALASNSTLPPLPNSIYIYRNDLDTDASMRFQAETGLKAAHEKVEMIEARLSESNTRTVRAEQSIGELQERIVGLEQVRSDTEGRLREIEASTIWRATSPVRAAARRAPWLTHAVRLTLKVAWWTVTLQLPTRYRMRRDARRQPANAQVQSGISILASALAPDLRAEDIKIKSSDDPKISIIISTYGQLKVTLACLNSIARSEPKCGIEVIVVDDAYPGIENMKEIGKVSGIAYVKNDVNLGFLLSCNKAAALAKGKYLYFLNNDTELLTNSIDALVNLLDSRSNVGLVGSKLLFSDGRLQEAGGILWNDGSGWNYGRGDDASRPEYNYVRETDYCSGASIMVRQSLFHELNGFDERLKPAYYEDVDLAIRIRAHGFKVLYEPRSVVFHHEGMSHGTNVAVGMKAHQVSNQASIRSFWSELLASEHYPNATHMLRARDRAKARKVILVIDHYTPEPDRDAGSRSVMGIIKSLVNAGWQVKFWPHNRAHNPLYAGLMEAIGIEVIDNRYPGTFDHWIEENGSELDHALVVRPTVAIEVISTLVKNTNALLSYYGVDLHFVRMMQQASKSGDAKLALEASAMERLERRLWRNFDLIVYPSEEEAAAVRAMDPNVLARSIVPFFFDSFPARSAAPSERSILFVAGFAHPPNVDAAMFLIKEVIPLLEPRLGSIKVVLAGSNPTDAVKALASPSVVVTGFVTDEALTALYGQHRAAVVPLRFGAGVKGKVIEALSHGLPLVTTSVGAQGIVGLAEVVPVHDTAAKIAGALEKLLSDDELWMTQSRAQIAFSQKFFSQSAMQASVLSVFETLESAHRK